MSPGDMSSALNDDTIDHVPRLLCWSSTFGVTCRSKPHCTVGVLEAQHVDMPEKRQKDLHSGPSHRRVPRCALAVRGSTILVSPFA